MRRKLARDIDEELRFHLDMRAEEYSQEGRGAARRKALQRFGDFKLVVEACRSAGKLPPPPGTNESAIARLLSRFGVSMIDVRLGVRMLTKHPGLTGAAVFALAVGIPVGLAPMHAARMFEADPPFEEGRRVRILKNLDAGSANWVPSSLQEFFQWSDALSTFEALGVTKGSLYNIISDDGLAEPVPGAVVSASTFNILRILPQMGRTLDPSDELIGGPEVVVIGHAVWKSRLDGDPDAIGRTIRIGGVPHTVVGVMPEGFLFPFREGLWLPLRTNRLDETLLKARGYLVFGRLADGISLHQAQADLSVVGRRMAVESPETHALLQPEVVAFTKGLFGIRGGLQKEQGFYAFQVLALLILVVACANVGMLIFTRTVARSGELAVRTALGASRARVVMQLFVESLVLAVLAAGVGLLVADQISSSRFDMIADVSPPWFDLGVTRWTVAWAFSLAVLSAGVMGVVPALKVTGKKVRRHILGAGEGRSGVRFGALSSALTIANVTLAVATVPLAVGVVDGLTETQEGTTFEADQFLSARLRMPHTEPARASAIRLELIRRLEAEPGIRGVAVGTSLPGMDHPSGRIELDLDDDSSDPRGRRVSSVHVNVGYFDGLDHPILAGRGFEYADLSGDRSAVIVNTNFVNNVLGGRNPLGMRVRYVTRPTGGQTEPWLEIVGVVGSFAAIDAGLFHVLPPEETERVLLAVHVGDEPESFIPRMRALAAEVDPAVIISRPMALNEVFSFAVYVTDWITWGGRILTGILLALSVSGIYAIMSFTVVERTSEIGIRIALGAQRSSIVLNVAKRALVQLFAGIVIGVTIALGLLTVLKGGGAIPTQSPLVMATALGLGVTVLIGVLACTAPTLRALRIMPTEALRGDG